MNTTFLLSGGIGRVITSIPALEKYHLLNPEDDFRILTNTWDYLFWSNPTLQKRTFDSNIKGCFDNYVLNYNLVVPEPYTYYKFYREEINLIEAFDDLINKEDKSVSLKSDGYLYLSTTEKASALQTIEEFKQIKKKTKVVVFQPYGSAVNQSNNEILDISQRSLSLKNCFEIIKILSEYCSVVFMGQDNLKHVDDNISISLVNDYYYMRSMMGIISCCDYFIGIDSVGQHIAKSFKKPGTILMGSTNEKNYSYPEHFNIFRKPGSNPCYAPWRISETDTNFANRMNDGIMDLSNSEIKQICAKILEDIFK